MKFLKSVVLASLLGTLVVSTPIQAQEKITILAEDDWAPYARPNGTGITNSLVRAAYREVGIDVEYEVVGFLRMLKQLEYGRSLAGFNLAKAPSVINEFNFGKVALFDTPQHYFVLKDSPLLKYTDRSQLPAQTRLGTIHGYMYGDFLDNNTNKLSIQPVPHHEQNLKKLLADRLDIVIICAEVAKELFKSKRFSEQLVPIFPGDNVPTYTAFSKTYPNSKHYMDLLDEGITKIKQNGLHAKILENCGDVSSSKLEVCL